MKDICVSIKQAFKPQKSQTHIRFRKDIQIIFFVKRQQKDLATERLSVEERELGERIYVKWNAFV